MTANNKQKILDLYSQIDSLYEQISLLEGEMGWLDTHRGEGNEYLREALSSLQSGQGGKWKEAVPIFRASYGVDFCIPGSNAYKKLTLDMYEQLNMPEAPDRKDHSAKANVLREKRINIRSVVHIYIKRMRKYSEELE